MTNTVLWLLTDLLLVGLVLALTLNAVLCRSLARAIVMFMALGLVLALIWSRLKAPDLALAEAAIGSGIAGALLLAALRETPDEQHFEPFTRHNRLLLAAMSGGLFILFAALLLPVLSPLGSNQFLEALWQNLPQTGVENPVTGVLLNYRAYDTLLEVLVLMCAALGILALGAGRPAQSQHQVLDSLLLKNLLELLAPLLVLVGGYLLWRGANQPGGAFQAGAVLAAAAILLRMALLERVYQPLLGKLTLLLPLGALAFVGAGLIGLGSEGFLYYRGDWAKVVILVIETAAMVSIATALTVAYLGGEPVAPAEKPQPVSSPEPVQNSPEPGDSPESGHSPEPGDSRRVMHD